MADSLIEIEIDGARNNQLFFAPLQQTLRGRIDFSKSQTTGEFKLSRRWPTPVPGMAVGVTGSGEMYVRDRLHETDFKQARILATDRGYGIGPERQSYDFPADDTYPPQTTWVHYMCRAVEGGHAKVIKGKLPNVDKLPGKPRTRFIGNEEKDSTEQLADALQAIAKATAENAAAIKLLLAANNK